MTEETADDRPRCTRRCLRVDRYGICDFCFERSLRDLKALPALYVELAARLAPGQGGGQAPVSGSKDRPIGVRDEVFDQMRLTVAQLGEWAHIVSDERRLAGPLARTLRRPRRFVVGPRGTVHVDQRPDRDPDATRVVILSEWLATHHEWSSRQTWSDDYAEEVVELAHNAKRLAGLYPVRPRFKDGVPCARCDFMSLAVMPGSDDVVCTNPDCAAVLRPAEYRDYLKTLVTPGRIAV